MKHLLRELGAAAIMLFALNVNATAQTLMGLPQYGVALGGTANDPTIINAASRPIIQAVVLFMAKDGGRTGLVVSFDRKAVPVGGSAYTQLHAALEIGATPPVEVQGGGFPAVEAHLSVVVFSDGEVVGPDYQDHFEALSMMRDMKVNLANILIEARKDPTKHDAAWAQMKQFDREGHNYRGHPAAAPGPMAYKLMFVAKHQGESAAYDWAEHLAATPKLWRSN